MSITEKDLDALHQLTQKRIAEIYEHGTDFRLAYSEHTYKGILAPDEKSIRFESRAPLQCGQTYEAKSGQFYVLAIASKAGMSVADVLPIIGNAVVYRKHLVQHPNPGTASQVHLMQDGGFPVLKFDGSEITAPRHAASAVGKVIKTASSTLEVVSARFAGCTAILEVRQYHAPVLAAPVGKTAPRLDMRGANPAKFYGSCYN